jgi:hypothetical protein
MIVDPWSSRTVIVPVSTTTVGRRDDCLHIIFFNLVLHIDVHSFLLAAKILRNPEKRSRKGREKKSRGKKTELKYFKLNA